MDELRVPKRRVAVEIALAGGGVRQMSLFLGEAAPDHDGPELPSDLVNGAGRFVPGVDEETGAIVFLNLRAVAVVRMARDLDAQDDAFDLPVEYPVELTLVNGSRLRGIVSCVRPEERSRLLDILNEPPPFVRLIEARTIALVNKAHIARIDLVPR